MHGIGGVARRYFVTCLPTHWKTQPRSPVTGSYSSFSHLKLLMIADCYAWVASSSPSIAHIPYAVSVFPRQSDCFARRLWLRHGSKLLCSAAGRIFVQVACVPSVLSCRVCLCVLLSSSSFIPILLRYTHQHLLRIVLYCACLMPWRLKPKVPLILASKIFRAGLAFSAPGRSFLPPN